MDFFIPFLFIFCASIQVGFWIFLFSKLALHKSKKNRECTEPLSLIVCYKNEAENISKSLPLLIDQDKANMEIIAINDFSTDQTEAILNSSRPNNMSVISAYKDLPGKKNAIKTGIEKAKNDLLLFTDADCFPKTNRWAQIMSNHSEKQDIVLGYSPSLKRSGLLNLIVRYETWLTAIQYLSYALAGLPYMGVGRNLLYKKSLFEQKKGFEGIDHLASGDDDLMISKMANKGNTNICIEPESFVFANPPVTWNQWIKQKSRHVSTASFYKSSIKSLLILFSASHVGFFLTALFGFLFGLFSLSFVLIVLAIKWMLQSIVHVPIMQKLKESDLCIWFPILDIMIAVYYLLLFPYLFIKDKTRWN